MTIIVVNGIHKDDGDLKTLGHVFNGQRWLMCTTDGFYDSFGENDVFRLSNAKTEMRNIGLRAKNQLGGDLILWLPQPPVTPGHSKLSRHIFRYPENNVSSPSIRRDSILRGASIFGNRDESRI